MNKVFVLKEKRNINTYFSECYTGVKSPHRLEFVTLYQEANARRYIKSFLRQMTYNTETIGSIEFALNSFVDYLESIELEESQELRERKGSEDIIDDRFDILDL